MGGRSASSGMNTFAEGGKSAIHQDVFNDLMQKERKRIGDDTIAKWAVEEEMEVVDNAMDYLENNGVKRIIQPSDDYAGDIKWKFTGKDKSSGEFASFEFDSKPLESDAKNILKGNGYSVSHDMLMPTKLHDYLVDRTDMTETDIRALKSLSKVALSRYKK